jgi:hypothetical protein
MDVSVSQVCEQSCRNPSPFDVLASRPGPRALTVATTKQLQATCGKVTDMFYSQFHLCLLKLKIHAFLTMALAEFTLHAALAIRYDPGFSRSAHSSMQLHAAGARNTQRTGRETRCFFGNSAEQPGNTHEGTVNTAPTLG